MASEHKNPKTCIQIRRRFELENLTLSKIYFLKNKGNQPYMLGLIYITANILSLIPSVLQNNLLAKNPIFYTNYEIRIYSKNFSRKFKTF